MVEIRDFSEELLAYIEGIVSGKTVACRMNRLACLRHLEDIQRSESDDFEFWFDMESANVALTILNQFKVPIGKFAGQKMEPFDFQVFIFAMLFGWREKQPYTMFDENGQEYDTYLRRFRDAFISLGRGNTKTPIAAIISILLLAFDRPFFAGAEIYLSATREEETNKTFDFAQQLIDDSVLDGFDTFAKAIIYKGRNYIKKLSSVTGDSFEIQGLIRDELHAWRHKHRDFYSKLRTGLGKRPQPLAATITTAGDDQSIIWQEEDSFARSVLDPDQKISDDRLFVIICEIDEAELDPLTGESTGESDDIFDESIWPKANPAMKYGLVNMVALRQLANRAKNNKAALSDFKRYHMNRLSTSRIKVFEPAKWARGHGHVVETNRETPWALGIDLGFRDDLCSISKTGLTGNIKIPGHDEDGREVELVKPKFRLESESWVPEGGPRDLDANPWSNWIQDGTLKTCPGDEVLISFIKKRLSEIFRTHHVFAVVCDRYQARELMQWIKEEHGIECLSFSQTCHSYNEPMREFITANNDGRISHDDGLLDWSANNLIARKNAQGYIMPDKDKSPDKIDPMVASMMSFAGAMYEKPKRRKSVYSQQGRGFVVV